MSRARWLPRPLVLAVLAWAILLGLVPALTDAAPIPSGLPTPADADRVVRLLEEKAVAARLAALGLGAEEVRAKLEALGEEERRQLAARLAELEAGGNAAGAIALVIIFALLVIIVLELMGRRVISRP